MKYTIWIAGATESIEGPTRMTYREILSQLSEDFQLKAAENAILINGWKVLPHDDRDTTLPAVYYGERKLKKDYLGDGVYVELIEYGQILLSTQRHNNVDEIYLDPQVLAAFERFVAAARAENLLQPAR